MTYFSKPIDLHTIQRTITNTMLCHEGDVILTEYIDGQQSSLYKTSAQNRLFQLGPANTKQVFENLGYDHDPEDHINHRFYYTFSVSQKKEDSEWLREFSKRGPITTTVDFEFGFAPSRRFVIVEFRPNMDNWQARAIHWKLHRHGSNENPQPDDFV
jgi:hypothetical protein